MDADIEDLELHWLTTSNREMQKRSQRLYPQRHPAVGAVRAWTLPSLSVIRQAAHQFEMAQGYAAIGCFELTVLYQKYNNQSKVGTLSTFVSFSDLIGCLKLFHCISALSNPQLSLICHCAAFCCRLFTSWLEHDRKQRQPSFMIA